MSFDVRLVLALRQALQHRRGNGFDQGGDVVALGSPPRFPRRLSRAVDSAAIVMSKDDDQQDMQHRDRVLERAENGVPSIARPPLCGREDSVFTTPTAEDHLHSETGVRAARGTK